MTLVVVKNKNVLSMPYLLRAALKYIYDRENMSIAEEKEMMQSIADWKNAIDVEADKMAKENEIIARSSLSILPLTDHKYSEEEIWQAIALLDHLVQNSVDLTLLSNEQKIALMKVTGQISRPDRLESRKRKGWVSPLPR